MQFFFGIKIKALNGGKQDLYFMEKTYDFIHQLGRVIDRLYYILFYYFLSSGFLPKVKMSVVCMCGCISPHPLRWRVPPLPYGGHSIQS